MAAAQHPAPGAAPALPAFANVTIDAAHPAAVPTADPRVSAAFALGWQMADLYRPGRRLRHAPAAQDDLPGLSRLDESEILRLGADQLTAGLATLGGAIRQAGLEVPSLAALETTVAEGGDADELRRRVMDLHVQLLLVLTAANFRLGKAYGLGRALADTCRSPVDIESVRAEFEHFRVATLQRWLDDLGSVFPPHAGHSVAGSLWHWSEWVHRGDAGRERESDVLRLLRRQGELWRALLSGEKLGTDMLEIKNYLDAASGLLKRMRGVVVGAILRFPLMSLAIVGLFGGGIALILTEHTKASIAAGVGGIVASLGLSWKGLGAALGKVAARLEQPLWGAELDAAIVDAITLLPDNKREHRDRRFLALQAPAVPAEREPTGVRTTSPDRFEEGGNA
jgi:hypothetical protein